MKQLRTSNTYKIFKTKNKNKKTFSGWCPFQGLSNGTTLMQIQSGRTFKYLKFIWAPCSQLYSLAETRNIAPHLGWIRGRYWSAKIDDFSLWPLIFAFKNMQSDFILWTSVLGAGGLPFFYDLFSCSCLFYPDLSFLYVRVCLATKIYNNLAHTLESKHFKTHVKGHNSNRKENVYDRTIPSQFYFQVSSFMDT